MLNNIFYEDDNQSSSQSVFTYSYKGYEKTRYQIIELEEINSISPVNMRFNSRVLADLTRLSRIHLLPKKPEIGSLCLFSLPADIENNLPHIFDSETIIEPASRVRFVLNRSLEDGSIRVENGKLVSSINNISILIDELEKRNMLSFIQTSTKGTLMSIPVSNYLGYLSNHFKENRIVFNSHFFLMDLTDLETTFDIMGEPYGLLMVRGKIISPPLYSRAAFIIDKNGNSRVEELSIRDIGIIIDNKTYFHGKNCSIFVRPENNISPYQKGLDIAVVGNRIVGLSKNGGQEVPEAGYVIHLTSNEIPGSLQVDYVPMEGSFGIQVGPPLIEDNLVLYDFKQPFYNGKGIKFPPTVYPPGWTEGRAARLGIGSSNDGSFKVIWAEGSKPAMYRPGIDSMGLTLAEFASIGKKHGMKDFINLDGGGSSQIAIAGHRSLAIADKKNEAGDEFERPIPIGLSVSC